MSDLKTIMLAALLIPSFLFAQTPDVHDFIYVDQEPIVLNLPDVRKAIGYPTHAIKKGIEGKVYCRVLVNEQGMYTKHRILNSAHPVLTKAVNPYLYRLKFLPAKRGKQRISYWTNIQIAFTQTESKLYLGNKSNPINFGVTYAKKSIQRIENAQKYLSQEQYEASILEFTRALMFIPIARKKPAKAASKLFGVYVGRAKAYIGNQQYEKATSDLIQAIGLGHTADDKSAISVGQIAEAYNLRSYCRLALGQTSQANQDINWVLFTYQDEEKAIYQAQAQQIAVYRQLSQYEKALSIAQDAIERSPMEANAYYQKGLVLTEIGANEAAKLCFKQALERNLENNERLEIEAFVKQGKDMVLEP